MRRETLAAAAVVVTMGGALALGCGSKSATCSGAGCGGSAATSSSASTTSTASSGSTSATGTGGAGGSKTTSGTGGNALCVQTGHAGACDMCCDSDYAAGYNTYVGALIQDCACTTGAPCFTQCSDPTDLCSAPSTQMGSAACIGCIDAIAKTDPCFTATTNSVNAACAADPSCVARTTCSQGCTGLPP